MPQYMVAVYHPDDYDPSVETEATIEAIHALNRELTAAGARKFACGLSPAGNAKSLRAQPDGKVLVTDGPYIETKERIGGFWILEAAHIDEALAWASELATGATVAQGLAKRAIDEGLDRDLSEGVSLEIDLFAEVFDTEDAATGVQSFLEHGPGKARFKGR